jgi:hypothetical protein
MTRSPGDLSMHTPRTVSAESGYLLTEALVYIGLVVLVLGLAFACMYRCVDNSVVLCRNTEDVTATMRAGERWRADIRSAHALIKLEGEELQTLRLPTERGTISYLFSSNTVYRSVNNGPLLQLLANVKSSRMQMDPRQNVTAWRWDVELLPRVKGYNKAGRVRPLFTFIAVPGGGAHK